MQGDLPGDPSWTLNKAWEARQKSRGTLGALAKQLGLEDLYDFSSETPVTAGTTSTGATPTGLPAYQTEAAASNLATLPAAQNLAGQVNAFNLAQQTGQLEAGLPDYRAMTQQSSQNILANLRGEVPNDVRSLLEQSGAERAVGMGMPAGTYGSTLPNYELLRSLGLTSLDQQKLGESQLTGAVSRTPRVNLYGLEEQFITPQQSAQYDLAKQGLAMRAQDRMSGTPQQFRSNVPTRVSAPSQISLPSSPVSATPGYGATWTSQTPTAAPTGSPWATPAPTPDLSFLTSTPEPTNVSAQGFQPDWGAATDPFWSGILAGLTPIQPQASQTQRYNDFPMYYDDWDYPSP